MLSLDAPRQAVLQELRPAGLDGHNAVILRPAEER